MSSNLPPGVTESMLPGSRPEDIEWDELWDWVEETLHDHSVGDIKAVIRIGLGALKAHNELVEETIKNMPGPLDNEFFGK
jgi:hypothetical protein